MSLTVRPFGKVQLKKDVGTKHWIPSRRCSSALCSVWIDFEQAVGRLKQKQQHLSMATAVHAFFVQSLIDFFSPPPRADPNLIKTQVTSSYGTSITSTRHFTHNAGHATGGYPPPSRLPIMTVTSTAAAVPITPTPVLETRSWVTVVIVGFRFCRFWIFCPCLEQLFFPFYWRIIFAYFSKLDI